MTSCTPPENDVASDNKNFTIASTFEKVKSLKFELLFGDYRKKLAKEDAGPVVYNAAEYFFSPGQVFGFACQSYGADFGNFHHAFVLRACAPGENGNIITGIMPGAEILVGMLTSSASMRLRLILIMLSKNNINLPCLSDGLYRKLHLLLEAKINTNFFVDELIAAHRI